MEEHFTNHTVTVGGDYEMCFINRYSLLESKKVMWELDVTGEEEELETNDSPRLSINQTLEEYTQQARELRIGIVKVLHLLVQSTLNTLYVLQGEDTALQGSLSAVVAELQDSEGH